MAADVDVFAEWSRRHDNYDVSKSALVRGWLHLVHGLARPLVRVGAGADLVTAASVLAAASSASRARSKPRSAACLVLASVVLDGVDGAVAIRTGRESRYGVALDHAADRASDLLFALALRRAGCPRAVAFAAATTAFAFEAMRDASRRSGRQEPLRVTVGDRPGRVLAVVAGLLTSPAAGGVAASVLAATGAAQMTDRLPFRHSRMCSDVSQPASRRGR